MNKLIIPILLLLTTGCTTITQSIINAKGYASGKGPDNGHYDPFLKRIGFEPNSVKKVGHPYSNGEDMEQVMSFWTRDNLQCEVLFFGERYEETNYVKQVKCEVL